jgi:hypothetical protein
MARCGDALKWIGSSRKQVGEISVYRWEIGVMMIAARCLVNNCYSDSINLISVKFSIHLFSSE